MAPNADIAIMVALEDELRAWLALLPDCQIVDPPLDPWVVYEAELPETERGRAVRIVFTRTTQPGQLHANTLSGQVIARWRPRFIIITGIAAAPRKKDARLGDIVIGWRAFYYVPAKVTDGGLIPRYRDYPCSERLINWAVAYERHVPNWFGVLRTRPKEEPLPDRPTYDHPKIHEGVIASGEYLIRSEEFMDSLVDMNDYVRAAETESASFCHAASEVYQEQKPEVIIIRAITDYGDKTKGDTWREYACEAAATYALGVISQRIQPSLASGSSVIVDPDTADKQREYLARVGKLPSSVASLSEKQFPLLTDLHKSFFELERKVVGERIDLAELVLEEDAILLHGVGGSGKTSLVYSLIPKWIARGFVPILLDLKDLTKNEVLRNQAKAATTQEELFDVLLSCSRVPIDMISLLSFLRQGSVIVVVDSFNELSWSEDDVAIQTRVLASVDGIAAKHRGVKIVIADRYHPRSEAVRYKRILLRGVEEQYLRDLVTAAGLDYESLSGSARAVLEIPLFLDIWLVMREEGPVKKSSLLEEFMRRSLKEEFRKRLVKVTDEELDRILAATAELAFKIYENTRSLFFTQKDLDAGLNPADRELLTKSDLIHEVAYVGGNLRFRHQVFHDYLAACYVANKDGLWNFRGFDPLSWEGQNVEPIYFALERLESQSRRNDFVEKVYDWFYPAALFCLREDEFFHEGHSVEIGTRTAVIGSVALKQLDFFPHSRSTAHRLMAGLPETLTGGYVVASRDSQARQQILAKLEIESSLDWYRIWKSIITATPRVPTEEDLNNIFHENAFIGWATSNFLRECPLEDRHWWWVSAGLVSSSLSIGLETTCYRLAHVLGVARFAEAVRWLFNVLDKDERERPGFQWVKYGAVRSLMEVAAKNEGLMPQVFEGLKVRAARLSPLCCFELSRALFIDEESEEWRRLRFDMLAHYKSVRASRRERVNWNALVEKVQRQQACEVAGSDG